MEKSAMQIGSSDIFFDRAGLFLIHNGNEIKLDLIIAKLLEFFLNSPNRAITRDELIEQVWQSKYISDDAINRSISVLRKALGGEQQQYIETIPKVGYRFNNPMPVETKTTHSLPQYFKNKAKTITVAIVAVITTYMVFLYWQKPSISNMQATRQLSTSENAIQDPSKSQRSTSVAVLPFINIGQNPQEDYFVDGLTEEILDKLAKLKHLRVPGRSSSFSFKGKNSKISTVAQELNVAHVLEGSVRKSGGNLRITAQLIDAKTDTHMWSKIYDRELSTNNIFEIQTEIATLVANELDISFNPTELEILNDIPTRSLSAYNEYLLGKQALAKRNVTEINVAVKHFQRALELDRNFAQAYTGLANSYILLTYYGNVPMASTLTKARRIAEKALTLDPLQSDAYASLGLIHSRNGDLKRAEEAFVNAIEFNPNNSTAYHWNSVVLGQKGEFEKQLLFMEKAKSLDPRSNIILSTYADDLSSLGKFDAALAQHHQLIAIDSTFAKSYWDIALLHWSAFGAHGKAVEFFVKALQLSPDNHTSAPVLSFLYLDLGQELLAEKWLTRSIQDNPQSLRTIWAKASLYAYRGENKLAAETVEGLELFFARFKRDHLLEMGEVEQAYDLYATNFPELLKTKPLINSDNYRHAIDFAYVIQLKGDDIIAKTLLEHSQKFIEKIPRLGPYGFLIADVMIHALLNDKKTAITKLRLAITEGWNAEWWYQLKNPNLLSLKEDPDFIAIVSKLKTDMHKKIQKIK